MGIQSESINIVGNIQVRQLENRKKNSISTSFSSSKLLLLVAAFVSSWVWLLFLFLCSRFLLFGHVALPPFYSTSNFCTLNLFMESRDGNGLDLIQDPRDPNPIGSDLDRFKMNLDRIWISMCGSKTDLEQIWIYLNI